MAQYCSDDVYRHEKRSHMISGYEEVQFPNSLDNIGFNKNMRRLWDNDKWKNADTKERLRISWTEGFQNNAFADGFQKVSYCKISVFR